MEAPKALCEVRKNISEIDFSLLPNEAKHELFEFYIFLLEKYKISNSHNERREFLDNILPRPVKKFIPFKRDEIYVR